MSKKEDVLVQEVLDDFSERVEKRKSFDLIWQINMNFLMGNQYCNVGYGGKLEEQDRQFFWQEREVFNHIAPIYDMRYAKLTEYKPDIAVLPATNDERDKQSAKVSKKIFQSVKNKLDIDGKINQAIKWSEVCGTVFYKIGWNSNLGQVVGKNGKGDDVRSGEIEISVVSPFEIYPDCTTCEEIEDCQSVIHAKVCSVSEVKDMYGVEVKGGKVNTYTLNNVGVGLGGLGFNGTMPKMIEGEKEDSVVVLEKYVKPSVAYPNGRLIIVAGNKLVYDGENPFACGMDGKRSFPFVKQTSIHEPGCFWGTSVIERLVPVQRAYNAVKNRKHEFLNRLSLGVLSVEDGSVDLDDLEDEGLCPGKVLVYRQGSEQPRYLEGENLPDGIDQEEGNLLAEFDQIGSVSNLLTNSSIYSNMSGYALELLVSQDEAKLNSSVESIKTAIKKIAKMILKLYKQFAIFPRLARVIGEQGQIEMFYFNSSDISSDDIIIETQTDNLKSISQRREMVMTLLDKGVFNDENGSLSNKMKAKIIEMLGIGNWESAQDVRELHIKKAGKENLKMFKNEDAVVSEIDDHSLHINEHIAFMLSEDFEKANIKGNLEKKFLKHINSHKEKMEG